MITEWMEDGGGAEGSGDIGELNQCRGRAASNLPLGQPRHLGKERD